MVEVSGVSAPERLQDLLPWVIMHREVEVQVQVIPRCAFGLPDDALQFAGPSAQ